MPTLTEEDIAAGAFAAIGADSPAGVNWRPFPNSPQQAAFHCVADVIGYGGAAGGGKSDLALGLAFTKFRRSIIFRREYPQLKDIITRGDEILDGAATFVSGQKSRWTLSGRTVELGAAQHEKDVNKYKGRPHDFIAFDEAADFSEYQARFLTGWLRTDDPATRPQVLMTFNPPTTPEGEWIVEYFAPWLDDEHANPAEPGEIRWFVHIDGKDIEVESSDVYAHDGKQYTPQSRAFFLARVEDNPVYMDTGYDKQLESLPEPLRSQLRFGDFTVSVSDDLWQVIPTAWILDAQNRWLEMERPALAPRALAIDPSRGGRDETVIAKLYGAWFDELIKYPGVDVPDGATGARYVTDALGLDNPPVYVDVIGIGASVYDHLKALPGVAANAVNVGSGSNRTDKTRRYAFVNLRAEQWWQFREALDPASGENIALPPDRKLRVDLKAPRYKIVSGKIKVESKEDIAKRIQRSTDAGDAVVMCWHGANDAPGRIGRKVTRYA